jgi:hypothetical protein
LRPTLLSGGITPTPAEINAVLKQTSDQECRFEDVSQFQDWEFGERLTTLTGSGQLPIVGFDYYSLFGGSGQEITGHCVVAFCSHERNGRLVFQVYDPGPKDAGFRVVDSESLYFACRKKHRGVWLIVSANA